MKKYINVILLVVLAFPLLYLIISSAGKRKRRVTYTINSDTNVSKIRGLSEYVTQEEVDDFGMRYSDIVKDKEKNATLIPLREALEKKDTKRVIDFLKEHNLSADVRMLAKRTPLMYSSFYNDVNTSRELLKRKADINASDRYRLSPLAYAIENNATKTVKLLIANGARFEDVKFVKARIDGEFYSCIDSIEIYEDNTTKINYCKTDPNERYVSRDRANPFFYAKGRNLLEILKMMLKSGYRPQIDNGGTSLIGIGDIEYKDKPFGYCNVQLQANYKQVLNLCLKYIGKPSKEDLKKAYKYCYGEYVKQKRHIKYLSENNRKYLITENTIDQLNNYTKYCSKQDGSFTPETYFAWANEWERLSRIWSFKQSYKDKVFYIKRDTNTTINKNSKKD
ncbi:MAG: ankyrin repeat domain-containing protein [Epsilonproteobacteria bacterium]|nr:ankyrin repeat domain-containing protein [Campylobacterota bacterium]